MGFDLLYGRSLCGIVRKQFLNEVFAFLWQVGALDFFPIFFILALDQHVIEELFFTSLFEGEYTSDQDKQDNSGREKIYL